MARKRKPEPLPRCTGCGVEHTSPHRVGRCGRCLARDMGERVEPNTPTARGERCTALVRATPQPRTMSPLLRAIIATLPEPEIVAAIVRVARSMRVAPRYMGGLSIWIHGRAWGVLSGKLWTIRPTSQIVIDAACAILRAQYGGIARDLWDECEGSEVDAWDADEC